MKKTLLSSNMIDWYTTNKMHLPMYCPTNCAMPPIFIKEFMKPENLCRCYPHWETIKKELDRNEKNFDSMSLQVNGVTVYKDGKFLKLSEAEIAKTQPDHACGVVFVFAQYKKPGITQTWILQNSTYPCRTGTNTPYWLPLWVMKDVFGYDSQKEDLLSELKAKRDQIDRDIKSLESK